MEYLWCYNRCHGNAVKGFWALWNVYGVITVAMVMLLRDFKLTVYCFRLSYQSSLTIR
jgi:hypothetical protein